MFGIALDQWLDAIQRTALIGGGLWALYLYRTGRRDQVKVGIEPTFRLQPDFGPGQSLLIVSLRIRNTSGVLWRYEQATATLFDARKVAADGALRLIPFIEVDPLLPVYGTLREDLAESGRGLPFEFFEGQEISLEPGEVVLSELSFVLDSSKLGLMAMRVWIKGRQRKRSRVPYEWASFFYIDPADEPSFEEPSSVYSGDSS